MEDDNLCLSKLHKKYDITLRETIVEAEQDELDLCIILVQFITPSGTFDIRTFS